MKRNREPRGGGTDQQWLFHLGVYGFDLQTELQINIMLRGKSKIQMTLNLSTLRQHSLNKWCTKKNGGVCNTLSDKRTVEVCGLYLSTIGSTSCRSRVILLFFWILSKTEYRHTYMTIKIHYPCDCDSILTPLSCKPWWYCRSVLWVMSRNTECLRLTLTFYLL